MSLEHISYSLNRQGCFLASLLKVAEPSSKWQSRTASGRAERQVAEPSGKRQSRAASGRAERSGAENGALFSYFLWRRERTFSSVEKEAKRHPPNPSPSLYGRGVTDYGGKPPCVRGLVWLTEPLPLRGEPWSFYRLARGVSHGCLSG